VDPAGTGASAILLFFEFLRSDIRVPLSLVTLIALAYGFRGQVTSLVRVG
jgi:hypothetical protein